MIEVTPHIEMGDVDAFFGNHWLAGGGTPTAGTNGESATKMNGDPKLSSPPPLVLMNRKLRVPSTEADPLETPPPPTMIPTTAGGHQYSCRLCGKVSSNGASLFAHLLYPHYAHLWRTEIPHRAAQYNCKQCSYQTTKRQHFVMHVARVHDDLKKKLAGLGENLGVLDNLSAKNHGNSQERIVSTIAKGVEENAYDPDTSIKIENDESSRASPMMINGNNEDNNGGLKLINAFSLSQTSSPDPFPRGFKPFVKCRLCGKCWRGKDNFFTHLVSTHFKHYWAEEVPKSADMYHCHIKGCPYQTKYRYNFLFHLAGKHKQLKERLFRDGISLEVLKPIETDGSEFGVDSNMLEKTGAISPADLMLMKSNNIAAAAAMMAGSNVISPGNAAAAKSPKPGQSNTQLICRVCHKVSWNHTCHRQHMVGKHFQHFWAHHNPDHMGVFSCHHADCQYKTPNRSVFVIHLAYVHSELRLKLAEAGMDPQIHIPDVYGKRKYRRNHYDNTLHDVLPSTSVASLPATPTPVAMNGSSPPASATTSSHEASTIFRCNLCKSEFPRYRPLLEHLALAHFNHVWDDASSSFHVVPVGPYKCTHCPFTSNARNAYISHIACQHEALRQVMEKLFEDKTIDDLFEEEEEDVEDDEGDDFAEEVVENE